MVVFVGRFCYRKVLVPTGYQSGWNDRGWARIFNALNEIINPPTKGSRGAHVMSSPQGALLNSVVPPPPPLSQLPSEVSLKNLPYFP